ncbi:MAG: RidA family protein [Nocardioidaceae bacterium]
MSPPVATTPRPASYRPKSSGGRQDAMWLSGRTADPAWEYFDVRGTFGMGVGEQAARAYAAIEVELARGSQSFADVTSVTEYVPMGSLRRYGEIEDARVEALGGRAVPVRTKVVDRLLHSGAAVEIEVSAHPGAVVSGGDPSRWHRSTVSDTDELVTLPTLLPIDTEGRIVAAGSLEGQYRYCLERAAELLQPLGLSLANVVKTLDYSTRPTLADYPFELRKAMLGPVYPTGFGICNAEMHVPGVLLALEVTASRLPAVPVNPGWSRFKDLAYNPALKIGRLLLLSGFVSMDQGRAWPLHYGDAVAQAELVYENIGTVLAAAGATPRNLVKVNEYLVPESIPDYAEMSAVRQRFLGGAEPAITSSVCTSMQWPVFLLETISTAILDG